MNTLEKRIEAIEQSIQANDFVPALIYTPRSEAIEAAKARYEALHNRPFTNDTPVFEFVVIDASEEGGMREVIDLTGER